MQAGGDDSVGIFKKCSYDKSLSGGVPEEYRRLRRGRTDAVRLKYPPIPSENFSPGVEKIKLGISGFLNQSPCSVQNGERVESFLFFFGMYFIPDESC